MDKVRAHREMLKSMWFNMDHSKTPIRKEIIVTLRNNPHWPGYGDIQVLDDGPKGYSSFKTHQNKPIEYAKNTKEYKSGKYKLIIKDETNK